ncbi:MAG: signal peptidase II [Planctomycetota bacterium]|jgi:signal peptidase II
MSLIGRVVPAVDRAWRSPRAWAVLLGLLAAGLAVDLLSKAWAFRDVGPWPIRLDREAIIADPDLHPIPPHPGVHVLPGDLVEFRLELNRGAVFGIAEDQRVFFVAFTATAFLAGLAVFTRNTGRREHLAHAGIAFVLAGGLGNLYDRIAFAGVRDFLRLLPGRRLPFGWTWPRDNPELFPWVFNVADLLLLTGVLMLIVHVNRAKAATQGRPGAPDDEALSLRERVG